MVPVRAREMVPSSGRTFATSNYKRFYNVVKAPKFQHFLLGSVHNVVKLYSARVSPDVGADEVEKGVDAFMKEIAVAERDNGQSQNEHNQSTHYQIHKKTSMNTMTIQ